MQMQSALAMNRTRSGTCYHESLQSQVGCGRHIDFLTPTGKEVLLLSSPVHGGYAKFTACTEEVQRPSQLLLQSPHQFGLHGTAQHGQQA